ncbi:MAG: RHS repeat protein [Lachnospiraceae bacterium]|nr:RHS repeat protein [Lachnospiraceae bacterium]
MRKRLLCVVVLLICCGTAVGFTAIKSEEEMTGDIKYEYDELNRIIKETYPDGTTIIYQYDKNGNLLETIVSKGTANTETGESNMIKGADCESEVQGGNPPGRENDRINENRTHTAAGSGLGLENTAMGWEIREHRFAPGAAVMWNAGWIIIIFLIVLLAGGAIRKIRKSRIQESGEKAGEITKEE